MIKYVVDIETKIEGISGITYTMKIESESPSKLLEALAFTNGTGNGVPTLDELLNHLYEKKAAYAGRNYLITINY